MGVKERKKKEKRIRRGQILDAARKQLFSKGIENVSISGIARAAELGVGTIYFHYKNKEDIFIALQEEGVGILHDIIGRIADSDIEPDEKLRQIALAFYEFSDTHQEYYNIISYFLSSPRIFFEADQKERVDLSGTKILGVIRDIVEKGNADGHFMEKSPDKFAVMFWGALYGLLHFRKLEQTTLEGRGHKDIYMYSVEKLIQTIVWD
ncbi:MAG TPA: hypothetical protein DHV36_05460 [Desulfobacteraceae bacterium]|nr:hypothetical protein [Desulfobacteraceae bacterium]|tara:strand:- start:145 stop:768 length:624 start_codon:yes stop_codon:yes gene_type:complete